jgi:hypothetical protein
MTTADVTKLACKFVQNVFDYLNNSKYIINPCLDNVQISFTNYKLSTTLIDCLQYEDECELKNVTSTISIPISNCVTINSCDNLVSIYLSAKTINVKYEASLQTYYGAASSFPVVRLLNNSLWQYGYTTVKLKYKTEEYLYEVKTGCFPGSPIQCSTNARLSSSLLYDIHGPEWNATGFVKTLRVYETDNTGMLINTPIDLDLSKTNLAAWTSCPLCSAISTKELEFGNPNWKNAFKSLLNNVSYTMYNALNASWFVSIGPTFIRIGNQIKNKPSSKWMGINKSDFLLEWITSDAAIITVDNIDPFLLSNPAFLAQDFSIATNCGNVTGRVEGTWLNADVSLDNSSFINYGLNSFSLSNPANITNINLPYCVETTLTAIYDTKETVLFTEWLNPFGESISNDLSVIVTMAGPYTFNVYLENGCIASSTYILIEGFQIYLNAESGDRLITENNQNIII